MVLPSKTMFLNTIANISIITIIILTTTTTTTITISTVYTTTTNVYIYRRQEIFKEKPKKKLRIDPPSTWVWKEKKCGRVTRVDWTTRNYTTPHHIILVK